jgi:hypothetical protein
MEQLWIDCNQNLKKISQYPVLSSIKQRESNWPTKSFLELQAKKQGYYLNDDSFSSRTFGFSISSGTPNFIYWCSCKNNCCNNWSKEWIHYQRIHWASFNKMQQIAFLEQHVDRNESGNKYFLPAAMQEFLFANLSS